VTTAPEFDFDDGASADAQSRAAGSEDDTLIDRAMNDAIRDAAADFQDDDLDR
jgi:hypothetical protein